MMTCPKPDQAVRVHYRPSLAAIMPHEGQVGRIVKELSDDRPQLF